jgi:hypothetical protein
VSYEGGSSPKPEATRRKDGKCRECRGPRKPVPAHLQKGVPASVYEREPFCSTECAKRYYGTPIHAEGTGGTRRAAYSKEKAVA